MNSGGKSEKVISELFQKHKKDLSYEIPTGLKNKILNDLFVPEKNERKPFISWFSFGGGAVAAGLALVMAFHLGEISGRRNDQPIVEEVVSAHIRSTMAQHLSDVISTDQHTVKPWFEGKLDFAPTVKDFASQGFPLIGGRLDYTSGRSTAALVYKFNQHIINVFEQPSASSENIAPSLKVLRGYQVFSWSKDGMNYWVVSDVNAADLQKFVELW